jgi:hypothetical protein
MGVGAGVVAGAQALATSTNRQIGITNLPKRDIDKALLGKR